MNNKDENKILADFSRLVRNRDNEKARELLETCVKVNPTVKILNNLGWLYMHVGIRRKDGLLEPAYNQAIDCFKRAIKIDTISHYPYTNLGNTYIKIKDYKKAQEVLTESVSKDHSIINQNNLACCLYYNKLYQEAEKHLSVLLEEVKENNIFEFVKKTMTSVQNIDIFMILYNLAGVKSKLKKYEDLESILKTLLEYYNCNLIDIEDVDIIDIIYIAYMNKEYQKVIELFPHQGYVIDENIFAVYTFALFKMGKDTTPFFNSVISEIKDEQLDTEDIYYKNELENRLDKIVNVHKKMLKENDFIIEVFPKTMESNYLF